MHCTSVCFCPLRQALDLFFFTESNRIWIIGNAFPDRYIVQVYTFVLWDRNKFWSIIIVGHSPNLIYMIIKIMYTLFSCSIPNLDQSSSDKKLMKIKKTHSLVKNLQLWFLSIFCQMKYFDPRDLFLVLELSFLKTLSRLAFKALYKTS